MEGDPHGMEVRSATAPAAGGSPWAIDSTRRPAPESSFPCPSASPVRGSLPMKGMPVPAGR